MRAVLELGPALKAADVQCTWRQLAAAELEDAEMIINDWQLGYGHDGATVIQSERSTPTSSSQKSQRRHTTRALIASSRQPACSR
jgi:hypothetical protein